MEKSDKQWNSLSNNAILDLLGDFIKQNRLMQNKTQDEIANIAGLNRTTLIQIENGGGGTLLSWIQIIRAIDQLYVFKSFQVQPQISPIQLAKLEVRKRQRSVTKKKNIKPNSKSDW